VGKIERTPVYSLLDGLAPLFPPHPTKEDCSVATLVLIEQAMKESSYDKNHIAYLARKGIIKGEKHGGVWLIDLESLKEYEARMMAEGTRRHTPIKYRKEEDEVS
jgi:hypothetical protein